MAQRPRHGAEQATERRLDGGGDARGPHLVADPLGHRRGPERAGPAAVVDRPLMCETESVATTAARRSFAGTVRTRIRARSSVSFRNVWAVPGETRTSAPGPSARARPSTTSVTVPDATVNRSSVSGWTWAGGPAAPGRRSTRAPLGRVAGRRGDPDARDGVRDRRW